MSIHGLCDHLEVAEQTIHLSNPTILGELVAKLPPKLQIEWGSYRQNCSKVNLKTFGTSMSNVVKSVSKVTVYAGSSGKPIVIEKNRTNPRRSFIVHLNDPSFNDEPPQPQTWKKGGHVYCVRKRDIVFRSVGPLRDYTLTITGSLSNPVDFVGTVWVYRFRHHQLLHSSRSNTSCNVQHEH